MNHLKKSKIIDYRSDDPRFGFTIKNSNEFNETIYPFHIKKTCDCKFMEKLKEMYPPVTRCWAERYENCVDLQALHDEGCEICKINVYDNAKSTIGWDIASESLDGFNPKKLDDNNFYDQTQISTILNPEIEIDRSPDIGPFEMNKNKTIEHYENAEIQSEPITKNSKILIILIILALIIFLIFIRK